MTVPHNIRPALTPLIGRSELLAEIANARRAGVRLFVVVGQPGIGKSRLVREVASKACDEDGLTGGVWWLDARPGDDASSLVTRLNEWLRVGGLDDGADVTRTPHPALVVVDQGHLLDTDSIGALAEQLCRAPRMTAFIVTRERLELSTLGRTLFVGPLATAHTARQPDAETLLVTRARDSGAPDAGTPQAPSIVRIVDALGGHPLALELAAERIATVGADALADRLEAGLSVLDASSGASPLVQALQATWDDLGEVERAVVVALSALPAAAPIDVVERVIAPFIAQPDDALEVCEALVRRCLVVPGGTPSFPTFALSKVLAGFVRARVSTQDPRYAASAARVRDLCMAMASKAIDRILPRADRRVRAQVRDAAELLLAQAAREAHALPDPAAAARMATLLLAVTSDYLRSVGVGRVKRVAALLAPETATLPIELQIGVGALLGDLETRGGDFDKARADITAAAELARAHREPLLVAMVLARAARFYYGGDVHWAIAVLDEAGAIADAHARYDLALQVRADLGLLQVRAGNLPAAEASARAALAFVDATSADAFAAPALNNLGFILTRQGRWSDAEDAFRQAVPHAIADGNRVLTAVLEANIAECRLRDGADGPAERGFEAALRVSIEIGRRRTIGVANAFLAGFALIRGDFERAATLGRSAYVDLDWEWADDRSVGLVHWMVALAEARLGRSERAQAEILAALACVERSGDEVLREASGVHRQTLELLAARGHASLTWPDGAPNLDSGSSSVLGTDHHVRFARRIQAALVDGLVSRAPRDEGPSAAARVGVPRLVVRGGGAEVLLPDGISLNFGRRPGARRVISLLASAERGVAVSPDDVFEAGWPGDRVGEPYRTNRVYVLIAKLRSAGFGEILRHDGNGYLFDPEVAVTVID